MIPRAFSSFGFNSQPPEGGWTAKQPDKFRHRQFQLTAARRRLGHNLTHVHFAHVVSTHSRPKAAGSLMIPRAFSSFGFNSQPPEGGWVLPTSYPTATKGFNSQPPEGGWAGATMYASTPANFNSQPPEGGWFSTQNAASCW